MKNIIFRSSQLRILRVQSTQINKNCNTPTNVLTFNKKTYCTYINLYQILYYIFYKTKDLNSKKVYIYILVYVCIKSKKG